MLGEGWGIPAVTRPTLIIGRHQMTYKDKAFCASKGCQNKCGRKLEEQEKQEALKGGHRILYGYFCCDVCHELVSKDNGYKCCHKEQQLH